MIGDISKSRSHTDAPRGRATSEDGVQNKDNLSPRVGGGLSAGIARDSLSKLSPLSFTFGNGCKVTAVNVARFLALSEALFKRTPQCFALLP
jgi:hypothetical protein